MAKNNGKQWSEKMSKNHFKTPKEISIQSGNEYKYPRKSPAVVWTPRNSTWPEKGQRA